jgi:hypothetical protein
MSVSILIPTFNRLKFNNIINLNISLQDYPLINEIIIADDGDERLYINSEHTILYYKVDRMSIGEKRNYLKSKATSKYIIHMDTDDFYNPSYISDSIFNLIVSKKSLSGSSDMIIYRDGKTYKQSCIYLNMLNEATLCYTKEYSNLNNFSTTNSGEGVTFCNSEDLIELDIEKIMICICHSGNTVNKKVWTIPQYEKEINIELYKNHLKLLKSMS